MDMVKHSFLEDGKVIDFEILPYVDVAWMILTDYYGVDEDYFRPVIAINGCTEETMNDILYYYTGYRFLEQIFEFDYDPAYENEEKYEVIKA